LLPPGDSNQPIGSLLLLLLFHPFFFPVCEFAWISSHEDDPLFCL